MEEQFEKESANCVEINLKKSSSKDGGVGFDIKVRCDGKATQEQMDKIAEISFKTALKTRGWISTIGGM